MIRIADIQQATADLYGLSPKILTRPDGLGSRPREYVRPRQVAMYLARQLCSTGKQRENGRTSLTMIGRNFGNRDHTTVLHGCRVIEKLMQCDSEERRAVGEVAWTLIENEISVDAENGGIVAFPSNDTHGHAQAIHSSATCVPVGSQIRAEA